MEFPTSNLFPYFFDTSCNIASYSYLNCDTSKSEEQRRYYREQSEETQSSAERITGQILLNCQNLSRNNQENLIMFSPSFNKDDVKSMKDDLNSSIRWKDFKEGLSRVIPSSDIQQSTRCEDLKDISNSNAVGRERENQYPYESDGLSNAANGVLQHFGDPKSRRELELMGIIQLLCDQLKDSKQYINFMDNNVQEILNFADKRNEEQRLHIRQLIGQINEQERNSEN